MAVLQYRWIGQVSDAERERRERTLQHATTQVAQELDVELVRAVHRPAGRRRSTLRATTGPSIRERVAGVAQGRRQRRRSCATSCSWTADPQACGCAAGRTSRAVSSSRVARRLGGLPRAVRQLSWRTGSRNPPDEPLRPAGSAQRRRWRAIVVPIAPVPFRTMRGHVTRFEPVFGYTLIRLDMRVRARRVPAGAGGEALPSRGPATSTGSRSSRGRSDRRLIYPANVDDLAALVGRHDAEADFFGVPARISSSSSAWPPTR